MRLTHIGPNSPDPKPLWKSTAVRDYRNLNKLTILNKYPLQLIDELQDPIAGAKVFKKPDLKERHHLIQLKKGDEHKPAFRTRKGHYEYKVRPFGLPNAAATFPLMMNKILSEFLDHGGVI